MYVGNGVGLYVNGDVGLYVGSGVGFTGAGLGDGAGLGVAGGVYAYALGADVGNAPGAANRIEFVAHDSLETNDCPAEDNY